MHEDSKTTYTQIYKTVGEKKSYLKQLIDFIQENYQIDGLFKYGKNSGWTIFFKKSGKSLAYTNIREKGFTVTVVIGESLANQVREAKLSKKTLSMFDAAKKYYDGRWLFFDVENKDQIEDIKKLIMIKKRPKNL